MTRLRHPAPLLDGYSLFTDENGVEFAWKNCEVPGCPNQVCVGRSDKFCWPHSGSSQTVEQMIEAAKTKESVS